MAGAADRFGTASGYALAVAAVLLAVAARALIAGDVVRVPPLSYFAAVTAAAWLGGYGPAMAAAAASLVVLHWQGTGLTTAPQLVGALLLVATGAALAWVAGAVRSARQQAEANAAAALRRQEELQRQVGDRERAERALHDQYLLTQSITDNATAALCMTDARGRCTYMNPAAEELLGVSFVQLRGRVLHDVLHAAHDGDGASCRLSASAPAQTLRAHVDSVRRADETRIPVLCAVTPIMRVGVPVGSVIELRDITVERRAERDRNALLQVTEQARLNAEAANRAKDEFLAVLSHELRSPLQAMVGWLAALRLHATDVAMVGRAVEALDRSLRVQGELVNDLLDVSRIISGKLTLERTWVDVALVAAAGVDLARPAAEQKGVALHFAAPRDAVPLRGDPGRLQQLIGNLLSNAIKFTPRGGRVEVAVSRSAGRALVVVRDSGEGIAGDVLPHIFERFRQADSQTTRAHGGLGLGLAIVRHLAEAHGGTAEASSAGPGCGASFRITLPLAEDSPPQEAAPPRNEAHGLAGVHVLLVDDDADSAEPLALALGEQGALVAQAASVAEALARLEREPFDVLVSDLGMPGESGLSLVRRLREREAPGTARLPAIALTGFASREDRDNALAAGFDDHLAKPVDVEVLMTRLSRAVRCRSNPPAERAEN